MHTRTAYLPLASYPEPAPDDPILATVGFATAIGCMVHATTFAVSIPQISSPLGGYLLDVPGLVRTAEEKSRADGLRLHGLLQKNTGSPPCIDVATRTVVLGAALDAAAAEARYYDLSVVPWSSETPSAKDMAQAVVFGSGRPTILVPPLPRPSPLDHVAIAWDGRRVAARALWDVLALLPENGRGHVRWRCIRLSAIGNGRVRCGLKSPVFTCSDEDDSLGRLSETSWRCLRPSNTHHDG
jgi:hypothetical protein